MKKRTFGNTILAALLLVGAGTHCSIAQEAARPHVSDLVVYGGTSAGVIAAVQAKKLGKSVVVVGPDKHLGGLTSGGLGWTDTGNTLIGWTVRQGVTSCPAF